MSERRYIIKNGFTFYEDQNNEYSGLFRYKTDKAENYWKIVGHSIEGGYYGQYMSYITGLERGYLGFDVWFYRDQITGKLLDVYYVHSGIAFETGNFIYGYGDSPFQTPRILGMYLNYLFHYVPIDEREEKIEAWKELIKDPKYQREDRLDIYGSLFITDKGLIDTTTIRTLYRDLGISVDNRDCFLKDLNKFWEDYIPEEWLPEGPYMDFRFDSDKEIDPSLNTFVFEISNKDIKHGFTNENSTQTAYDYDYDNKYIGEIYIKKNINNNYKLKITPDDIPIEWTQNEDFRQFASLEIDLLTNRDQYDLLIFDSIYNEDIQGPTGLWKKFTIEISQPSSLNYLFVNKYFDKHHRGGPLALWQPHIRVRNQFCFYNLTNDINRIITNNVIFSVNNKIVKNYKVRYNFRNNDVNELYINVLNFQENQVFRVGETKTIDIQFRLPVMEISDRYTDPVLMYFSSRTFGYFSCFTQGIPKGEKDPFDFSYSFDFNIIEKYDDLYNIVDGVIEGSTTITITCKHKNFTRNNKIYIGLAPFGSPYHYPYDEGVFLNLGHENIPYDEISFLSEFYIDIPEGTKFEIFNDRIDVLNLDVLGTLPTDDIYYEYEFIGNDDFDKRLINPIMEFNDSNNKLRVDVMGQDSDLRTKTVFYNLTDHDFEGILKLNIKAVNGVEVDNNYYEIPVVYHKEQEHNFMLKNANISINADSSGTVRLGNIFNSGYGVGQLRNNSQLSISGLFISYSDRNVFQEAEGYFGSYGQNGGFELHNVKQNTTVNNKQTRLFIYPYFEGITGNEDFLNDEEMFPRVVLDINQKAVSLTDPFVNDDRFDNSNEEATVLRLNNIVSTPITQNKYSVNLTNSFSRDEYLKLTDDLYFIEPSPIYINQTVSEVILHYEYKAGGNLNVSFMNQDTYLPSIQDVTLDKANKTVTVKLIRNKNQTSQGYVTLYDGNIGVKIGIFQTYGK